MNANSDNLSPQISEPLPAEFESELADVDRLLARAVHEPAPVGLAQRVFEMSVQSMVAGHEESAASRQLQLIGGDAMRKGGGADRFVFAAWRKYALAASVLVVAGIALWTTWPQPPRSTGSVAGNRSHNVPPNIDVPDLHLLADDIPTDVDTFESRVAYLLDASEMHSDDLNSDLRRLVQKLEM